MKRYVFISYCNADRPYVDRLAAHLTSAGLSVWYDYELHVGDHLSMTIQEQINRCSAVIPVLTPHATHSDWVRLELSFAHRLRKPMYPLLLSPCRLPLLVSDLFYDDVTGGALPSSDFVDRVSRTLSLSDRRAITSVAPPTNTQPHRGRKSLIRPQWRVILSAILAAIVIFATATVLPKIVNASTDTRAVEIGVNLPLKGPAQHISQQTLQLLNLYLDRVGDRVGHARVVLRPYDTTGAGGWWDGETCRTSAFTQANSPEQVAVIGPFDAGCADIETPILDMADGGPMLIVSHASGDAELTAPAATGQPDPSYPSGRRNYAQVFPTDDQQGAVAADFAARELGVRRCFVLNDGDQPSIAHAAAFRNAAYAQGVRVIGSTTWKPTDANYVGVFTAIKRTHPDCVYVAGMYDNNGLRLAIDKALVGDNDAVKLLMSSGFAGHARFNHLPEAADSYVISPGVDLDQLAGLSASAASLMTAFQAAYGVKLTSAYPLYAVQALQVILAAIAQAGNSRAQIRDAVFGPAGVTVDASVAILGTSVHISPSTGDVSVKDFSIHQISGGEERVLRNWRLPSASARDLSTACPQVTIDAVRAHFLPGNLTLLRYIETEPLTAALPGYEIWICRDTDGTLYFQGNRQAEPLNVATGDGALLLGKGIRGTVRIEGAGFVAINPATVGDTEYHLTPTTLRLIEPDAAATTYAVRSTFPP